MRRRVTCTAQRKWQGRTENVLFSGGVNKFLVNNGPRSKRQMEKGRKRVSWLVGMGRIGACTLDIQNVRGDWSHKSNTPLSLTVTKIKMPESLALVICPLAFRL